MPLGQHHFPDGELTGKGEQDSVSPLPSQLLDAPAWFPG